MREFLEGTALVIQMIYSILLYLGGAVALFTIARRNHAPRAWLAFIPILQFYIIGSLCEEYVLLGRRIRNLGWFFVLLEFLQIFLSFFAGFFFAPLRLVVNLLTALFLHKFFYLFNPRQATLYAILAMFGRLPLVIILFLLRHKPLLMSAGAYPYPFANRY